MKDYILKHVVKYTLIVISAIIIFNNFKVEQPIKFEITLRTDSYSPIKVTTENHMNIRHDGMILNSYYQ